MGNKLRWLAPFFIVILYPFINRPSSLLSCIGCVVFEEHRIIAICLPKCGSISLKKAFPDNYFHSTYDAMLHREEFTILLPMRDDKERLGSAFRDKIVNNFTLFRAIHFLKSGQYLPKINSFEEFSVLVNQQSIKPDKHWFRYEDIYDELRNLNKKIKIQSINYDKMGQYLVGLNPNYASLYRQRNKTR